MSPATARTAAVIEPASVYLLIMAYIWELRAMHHDAWLPILAWMLLSHGLHGENPEKLGFEVRRLWPCFVEFSPSLAFLVLTLLASGFLFRSIRPVPFHWFLYAWSGYLPWGLFQQYVMNGYFLNRLEGTFSPRSAPLVVAVLFSGAHLPNWFLMGVGFLAGYCCALIYRKYKNLYFLGVAHATVGVLLLLVVPDSISHHLIVGPSWFRA
jgi:membrane protease YdiL (CAAX protease family)